MVHDSRQTSPVWSGAQLTGESPHSGTAGAPCVEVAPVGGLGNRLFQVAAAWSVAKECRTDLAIVWPHERDQLLGGLQDQWLWDFAYFRASPSPRDKGRTSRYVQALRERCSQQIPVGSGVFSVASDVETHGLSLVGSGYFQSSEWVSHATRWGWPQAFPGVRSDRQSIEKFADLLETRALGIHVRLGDYKNFRNRRRIGLLPPDYFRRAWEWHVTSEAFDRCLLFSDEPDLALRYLGPWSYSAVDTVVRDLGPSDTLYAMSLCHALILSNSTFAWWAAHWMASSHGRVTYPAPWTRKPLGTALAVKRWHALDVTGWQSGKPRIEASS